MYTHVCEIHAFQLALNQNLKKRVSCLYLVEKNQRSCSSLSCFVCFGQRFLKGFVFIYLVELKIRNWLVSLMNLLLNTNTIFFSHSFGNETNIRELDHIMDDTARN